VLKEVLDLIEGDGRHVGSVSARARR
jgi:hypothetical protein